MPVQVCNVSFSDWVSLPLEGQYSDTFIFRISSQACLPPFSYVPLLKRMAAKVLVRRFCASLWVQVDAPGQWFAVALHNALKGLRMPFIVTNGNEWPAYEKFSLPPVLTHSSLKDPPAADLKLPELTKSEVRCLQALGRMIKGDADEIASLSNLTVDVVKNSLGSLQQKGLVEHKTGHRIFRKKSSAVQPDPVPLWHPTKAGVSAALRSWAVPFGIAFASRKEKNPAQIGYSHRRTARLWLTWLKAALPRAEIWTGWCEVHIPGISVIPDGLAWGRMDGREVLFWLEVGDMHKSRDDIRESTRKRLEAALQYSKMIGMYLVYTQLSSPWVQQVVTDVCDDLPAWAAVVLRTIRHSEPLPNILWGKVNR